MTSMWCAVSKMLLCWSGRQIKMSPRNVVFITGCDSGLGFSLTVFCHSLNMTVIAACHNVHSEGARILQHLNDPKRMIIVELDLLRPETIARSQRCVAELMQAKDNSGESQYEFTALVNNAGIMCFGEFEWQTNDQFETQINVNLLGTMRLTKKLLPLVRQHRGRIINITSHCGLQALPALAPYAASKAGLRFWNDALRVEMRQYGVNVINFVPGSFVMASNISARQQEHAVEMLNAFTTEQHQFYDTYFNRFHEYLKVVSGYKAPNQMNDTALLHKFQHALTNERPKTIYIHEPWRYKFYRVLFGICPTPIVDWLTVKFCAMPTYQQATLTVDTAHDKSN